MSAAYKVTQTRYGTLIKHATTGYQIKRAPPKPMPPREEHYACSVCHEMIAESQLLMCDKRKADETTCDTLVCLECAGHRSVPEGDFYCFQCL